MKRQFTPVCASTNTGIPLAKRRKRDDRYCIVEDDRERTCSEFTDKTIRLETKAGEQKSEMSDTMKKGVALN